MLRRLLAHARDNAGAYVALFVALGGTAVATEVGFGWTDATG
jgi:hypothetical protein